MGVAFKIIPSLLVKGMELYANFVKLMTNMPIYQYGRTVAASEILTWYMWYFVFSSIVKNLAYY